MKFRVRPLKYSLLFFLIVGGLAFAIGYFVSASIMPKPELSPNFFKIFLTNFKIHMTAIVCSFLTGGLFSVHFVFGQFFIVGVLIGGATHATGNLVASLSFFWVHGIFELAAVLLTSSVVPFFFLSVLSLVLRKVSVRENFMQILKKTSFLFGIIVMLILVSALVETFIAPKLVIVPHHG